MANSLGGNAIRTLCHGGEKSVNPFFRPFSAALVFGPEPWHSSRVFSFGLAMHASLTPRLLSLALVAALAACSPAGDAPTAPAPKPKPTPTADTAPAPAALPAAPTLSDAQRAQLAQVSASLRPAITDAPMLAQAAGDETWVDLAPGKPFLACIQNAHTQPVLVSVSIQGQNVDLRPAHPYQGLLRLEGQVTRCLPEATVAAPADGKPPLVAWAVFLADGADGSSIQDTSIAPPATGRLWLGKPADVAGADPWPGFVQPEAAEAATPTPAAPAQ